MTCEQEYSKGNTCPECGKLITNRANKCKSHAFKVRVFSKDARRKMSESRKGLKNNPYGCRLYREDHPNWKGGITKHISGRVLIRDSNNSMADVNGYVLRSRLVKSQELGRPLSSKEIVHHKNGDISDDNPENLELTNRATHISEIHCISQTYRRRE